MKKKYIKGVTGMFLLMVLLIISCKKDTGNYNYQDINETNITEIKDVYTVLQGMNLAITPKLSFTKDNQNDSSKYTYKWLSIDASVRPSVTKVISTSRNLNWTVSLPPINGSYTVYYIVTEKSTGVSWRKQFILTIGSEIVDGWVVLNDIDNTARVDYLNYDVSTDTFLPYTDVISTLSNLKLKGKPKMVYFYNRRDTYINESQKSIFVGTDQNTFVINTNDHSFTKYTDILNIMTNYYPPAYFAQSVRCQLGPLSYLYDNLGQLFFESPGQAVTYSTPVNTTITGERINISPMYAEGYMQSSNYGLFYDVDKKRFLEHKGLNYSMSVPALPPATPGNPQLFDPGNIGMELIYMASTIAVNGQTYALLKNSGGKLFLARIICDNSTFVPLAFDEISTAPQMAGATQFAIDPQQGYLMYVVGSKVYRYNVYDKSNSMVIDYGTRKISLMKYQKFVDDPSVSRYAEYSQKLIVCTYEETSPNTSGKMDFYNVPNLNGALSLYKSFDGFGKIVDLTYRE